MYRPCLHCEGKKYDESYCPQICQYGETRKRLEELEKKIERGELGEVRHGRWEYVDGDAGYTEVRCSVCKKTTVFGDEDDISLYCQYCGTKMDKEHED